ncbi:alkyl hydroperoxide reductase subunit C [Oenococcus kitaharae]|uniref:Alkyl hydroperoxide reductase C n=1 Tax=Oenococcus kitaharae DSM 17330 TaxID=1045004 RepID=G9WJ93_9LACO|nr:alkyl hydroperoxide reductase subunit C [Oenococcus kitaharae]EHN58699.1 Alkyl hydroperoxide reductase protein C [Oenococcus kitaharae DSM 17330]MCV3297149.1 alkyl hydroperoxide reductase subunit C [Oenococcus kitaharae]OEY83217.1 alkyl hydroperoxide reductase [Oenococcus kitaharae]OEY84261.1 alkyl hydroperoxide reductase [Oenococcus kitaharae]OEY85897.1 alkyl hydroperoxide reductase [Oenococcus kitaharae]
MNFINNEIADFKVNAYQQGKVKEVTKKNILGKWSIFFFYPADFSFVCPTELGDLQDHYEAFKKANAEIYSVSEDSEFVHKAWAEATDTIGKVQYPMLADPAGKLARFFEVLDEDAGQAFRGVFIIDPAGKIRSYTINDMGIGRNAAEILRTLEAAQFVAEHGDKVCPANWHPGEDSITPSLDLVGKI